jgi:hypothetical protein
MKKISIIIISILILAMAGGGAFYGGTLYGKSNGANDRFTMQGPGGSNFNGTAGANKQGGAGFNTGEIISKDNGSITIKLAGGGSKIIFFSSSTEISKSATGSSEDLEIGKNVMVQGTTNSDGSIAAKSIQIRPLAETPPSTEQPK